MNGQRIAKRDRKHELFGELLEPKIDEKEWMKATEPTVGELPETVVEAEAPENLIEQYFGKLKTVGEKVEKAIDVVGKPLVKYGKIGVAPLVGKPLAEVGGAVTGVPFEVAKRPFKDIQIPHYAEQRGKAMQGFVENFMKPEGKKSAQEFMDIERKMTKEGLLPESRAITLPIEMFFAARILGRGVAKVEDKAWWDKFLQKNYEKQVFSQEDVETIVSKIRRALIDGGEDPSKAKGIFKTVLTAKELKVRVGSTKDGLPIFKTVRPRYIKGQITPGKGASYWTPKQVNKYVNDVYKITTEKGALPFRPKTVYPGTAEVEARHGITPAGKLAPRITPTTTPKVIPEPSTAGVPTFLSPKTQELMARAPGVAPSPVIEAVAPKKELPMTRPHVRVYKPESAKSLVEKYREAHGGEEPPLLDEAEVAKEVERVMTKPTPRPPEEMGGLPEYLKPKDISMKIHSLYGRLEAKGIDVRGITQEKTILRLIGKGQEQTAREAFREGKAQGVIEQKDKFDDYVARASWKENMRGRVEKARGTIGKASTLAKHHELRPIAQKYVDGIMNKLDLSKPRTRTIHELQSMADFIKEHPEHNIPQHHIDKLQRLAKTPIQDLTVDEIEMIANETTAYVRQSALINKMIIKGRLREADKISTEAVTNIQTKPTKVAYDPKEISSEDFEKRVGVIKQLAGVKSWNAELISEILDYKGTTQIHDIMYKGVDAGTDKQLTYQNNAEDFIGTEVQKAGIKDLNTWSRSIGGKKAKPISVSISRGRKIRMTKGERVAFILHSMNAKNVKHITRGGFAFEHNKTRIFRGITNDDINAIVKSATPEEMKMVGIIRKSLDMMGEELNKTSMSLYGREIFKEPNYWRIRTNSLDRRVDALKVRGFGHKTLEGMGFLKERRNASNAIVLEDAFSTLYKHVKQTSAFHGLAEPLRNAKMLLHDKGFKMAVMKHRGGQYWRSLKRYLDDVEGMSVSTSDVEKIATGLINKIDLAVLGVNPFVMLKQPVSYGMATTEMSADYLRRAGFTRPNFDEISKWSPQLRDRLKGRITRELGELGQVGAVRQFFTGKSPLSHKVMEGIRFFDLQTIGRVWNAAKLEVAELHPTLRGNEFMTKVKERAEEVIRKTQPTFMIKDRSEIGRDRSVFVRLLTKYTSQRNKNYIQLRRAWNKYEISGKGAKSKANLLKRWATIVIANAVAIEGINELRNLIYKRKTSPLTFALNTIGTAMGNMYFVGDVFKSIASKFEKGTTFGYDLNNPLSSAVNDVIDAVALTSRGIDQIVTGERYTSGKKTDELKWKSTMMRALDKSLTGVSMFAGVPYRTIRSFIRGGYRWLEPKEETLSEEEQVFGTRR